MLPYEVNEEGHLHLVAGERYCRFNISENEGEVKLCENEVWYLFRIHLEYILTNFVGYFHRQQRSETSNQSAPLQARGVSQRNHEYQ
jgi:hypothetical protein